MTERTRRPRPYVFVCIVCVVMLVLAWSPRPYTFAVMSVRAQYAPPDAGYIVQPGDTLPALAARFGVETSTLTALNNLSDPRAIFPGQPLSLPPNMVSIPGVPYHVALADHFSAVARRAGGPWETLAAHNRLLNPTNLVLGQLLVVPHLASGTVAFDLAVDAHIATALRQQIPYWLLRHHNPQPRYTGDSLLLPDVPPTTTALPYPLTELRLSSQPVMRGTTAVLTVTTAVSATCESAYLDFVEACHAQTNTALIALIGVPPLIEPGPYTMTLTLRTLTDTLTLPLPLHVSSGRYDFERIDLPPSRQSLLDPAKSQWERDKIAQLRTLRSPERLWEYPFIRPVEASVTSYYGSRRSYGWGFNSFHGGTDFRGEIGTPILAPASGTVILAEPLVVRGNAILIDHGWGIVSGYWHLSRIEVTVGQAITQGMRIGALGNTGLSTGPHLHWELWVNGGAVSPLQWLKPTLGTP